MQTKSMLSSIGPGERNPEEIGLLLLLTVADVSTTCAVVILRVKVSCIASDEYRTGCRNVSHCQQL